MGSTTTGAAGGGRRRGTPTPPTASWQLALEGSPEPIFTHPPGCCRCCRREVTSAGGVDRAVHAEDEAALRRGLAAYFPSAAGRLARAAVCTFTNTPDEHFLLDLHPRHPQVVLCSACSGHGFKFSPVLGEMLADLATRGAIAADGSLFRISAERPGHAELLKRFGAAVLAPGHPA